MTLIPYHPSKNIIPYWDKVRFNYIKSSRLIWRQYLTISYKFWSLKPLVNECGRCCVSVVKAWCSTIGWLLRKKIDAQEKFKMKFQGFGVDTVHWLVLKMLYTRYQFIIWRGLQSWSVENLPSFLFPHAINWTISDTFWFFWTLKYHREIIHTSIVPFDYFILSSLHNIARFRLNADFGLICVCFWATIITPWRVRSQNLQTFVCRLPLNTESVELSRAHPKV